MNISLDFSPLLLALRLGSSQGVHGPVQVYFGQFRKTPFGMLRLDPQDAGPGYRNVIGIPGGIASPLFRVLQVGSTCSLLVYASANLPWCLCHEEEPWGLACHRGSHLGHASHSFWSRQERNVHGMKLIEGEGNTYDSRGKALEGDRFNTVFIVVCHSCLNCNR